MEMRIAVQNTDLHLCPIGLGTVNAGIAWSGKDAEKIFDAYLDNGGNLIDSARVYAAGKSEAVIGGWLKNSGKRDKVIIATKGGHPKYESPEDDLHISRMSRADMRYDIEKSLEALGTDYIDIYFYHRDDLKQPVEEEIETMEDFRREGLIRYYACSNWTAERIRKADRYCEEKGYRGFVADQALLNLGSKYMNPLKDDTLETIRGDLEQYHIENPGNLAMPYMGVASGFFHRYLTSGADSVKRSPYCTSENIKIAEHCREMMRAYNCTVTQAVLGFFSSRPFICLPLYGPKNEQQITEALKTPYIKFDPSDYII